MNDPRLNIKISASAELQALKATEAELIRTITAGQAAGKTFKDLREETAQLAAVQSRMKEMGFGGRLGAELQGMMQKIPILGRVMTAANGGVGLLSGSLVALAGAAGVARNALAAFSKVEDIQTTFVTLLGSVRAAKERMAELSKFASQTPFQLNEVAQASKVLEGLTSGALSTGDGLRMIGDVAAATGVSFSELAVTMGRLYQGLRDGTPVGEAAARITELTGINLRNAKSWGEVEAALRKFNGEMARRSATLSGKESTLGDSIALLMAQLGRPIAPAYKEFLSTATKAIEAFGAKLQQLNDWMERSGQTFVQVAATFGAAAGVMLAKAAFTGTINTLRSFIAALQSSRVAIAAETAEITRNTAAQVANNAARAARAARAAPASAVAAATGTAPFHPTGTGAPYSKAAYDSARKMGMNATDALAAARRAMWLVGEEAKKSAGAWGTLQRALGFASRAASSFANMVGPIGGALAGWALGDKFQKSVFNWAATLGAGGASTEDDIAAAQARLASTELSKFFETLREVRDVAGLETLKKNAAERLSAAQNHRKGLGWNQTLEKKAVDAEIAALERFISTLDRFDPARLAAIAAAQEKASNEALTAEVRDSLNRLLIDAANDASFDRLEGREKLREIDTRIRSGEYWLTRAGTREEKEEIAKRILDLTRQRHALLAQINAEEAKAAEEAAEKAELALETTAHLSNLIAIEAQRAKGNPAAAARMEAELEIDREVQDLRAKGVTDETLLNKYAALRREQADARLRAEKEAVATRARELDLQIRINEASAAGDERELARLRWLQEYYSLLDQGIDEATARRAANASSAEAATRDTISIPTDDVARTPRGARIGHTRRVRGAVTSDAHERGIDAGASLLDQYLSTRDTPVGARHGKSILGSPANALTAPADASGQLAQTLDSAAAAADQAAAAITAAAQKIESTRVGQRINQIERAINQLQSALANLARNT